MPDNEANCSAPSSDNLCYQVTLTWSWSGTSGATLLAYLTLPEWVECGPDGCGGGLPPHSACDLTARIQFASVPAANHRLDVLVPEKELGGTQTCFQVRTVNKYGRSAFVWANP